MCSAPTRADLSIKLRPIHSLGFEDRPRTTILEPADPNRGGVRVIERLR